MQIKKFAAFSVAESGGNPAGVVVTAELPASAAMQTLARQVGFSETVFAACRTDGWQVRYYSPEAEIPFCGHATVALGVALAIESGDGTFRLHLASGTIAVEGRRLHDRLGEAAFESLPSSARPVSAADLALALRTFGVSPSDLLPDLPPAVINAGADHLFLPLRDRATLSGMAYDFGAGQALMREKGWITVLFAFPETSTSFHVRNAFAYGGLYEDPATGAAAAALAGYLRAQGYASGIPISIHQGDDMGTPCRLRAVTPIEVGDRVRVSGLARAL
jgi:PhzF family phenazine biosynthesis protein